MLLYVLGLVFAVMSLFAVGTSFVLSQVRFSGVRIATLKSSGGILNGLALAREALKEDTVWGDCKGADQYCEEKDQNGLFPLYSPSLGEKLEDIKVNGVDLTVKAKVLNPSTALVVVKATYAGTPIYYGAIFNRTSAGSAIPLVYAPNSSVEGGYACSYFYDGKSVVGKTLPNFSVYLDSNFHWSPQIVVPTTPAGNNPKNVRFITNFDTLVSGYKEIDTLISTGSISVENGAELDLAYSDESVSVDDSSFVKEIVENGDYQYPDLAKELPNLDIENRRTFNYVCGDSCFLWSFPFGNTVCVRNYLNLDSVPDYSYVVITGDCKVHLSTKKVLNDFIVDYGAKATLNFEGDTSITSYLTVIGTGAKLIAEGEDGSFVLKSNLFGIKRNGYYGCPNNFKSCLIDANYFYNLGGEVLSTVLTREKMILYPGSLMVGNVFAEDLESSSATFCNVVNSSGEQIVNPSFYNLVYSDEDLSLPTSLQEELKVVCSSEENCLEKLE